MHRHITRRHHGPLLALLAAFTITIAAAVFEELHADQQTSGALTAAETAQLYVNQDQPAGGIYTFHPLHASWCTQLESGRPHFFRQGWCRDVAESRASFRQIAVIPSPAGGYTLRPIAGRDTNDGRLHLCATVARNVVIGPARIDALDCDVPVGSTNWGDAGGNDQRFRFRQVSRGVYEIVTLNNDCWDVRDQSRDSGAEIIQWACNRQANQRFELTYVTFLQGSEAQSLSDRGWISGSDGMRQGRPLPGVNLPGGDFASFPAANDGGRGCATMCAQEPTCRAYTWVQPGVQIAHAACWMKHAVPGPTRDKNTASGVIR